MKVFNPNDYDYVTVVEIPKSEIRKLDMALCEEPRQTLSQYYDSCQEKPDIIINGGFFNMENGDTCFIFEDENAMIAASDIYQEGMGLIGTSDLELSRAHAKDWRDFISAYPVLMREGVSVEINIAKEIDYKARRSILGYNEDNIYLIAVEKPGLTFAGCQTLLSDLGVKDAINLDGGGSTKILKDGKSLTSSLYNRSVDNVFAVYLKKNTLYRVQTGAFSSKANALLYLARIKLLKDEIGAGYKNAYTRLVDGLYKVQVGAFSNKNNALRVAEDLKAKGFSSFVTTE